MLDSWGQPGSTQLHPLQSSRCGLQCTALQQLADLALSRATQAPFPHLIARQRRVVQAPVAEVVGTGVEIPGSRHMENMCWERMCDDAVLVSLTPLAGGLNGHQQAAVRRAPSTVLLKTAGSPLCCRKVDRNLHPVALRLIVTKPWWRVRACEDGPAAAVVRREAGNGAAAMRIAQRTTMRAHSPE